MNKNKSALILGIVCMLLTIGMCVQIKTVEDANKVVGPTMAGNDGLKDELLKVREQYNNKYSELEKAEEELDQIRAQAVSNNSQDTSKKDEITNINKLLGYTEVKGSGVIVHLDDNRDISEEEVLNVSDTMVHYNDLIRVVNELFNAGADAISINDQRIVQTTGIVCDGNIIRVNGKMVGVPITVKAVGFPERLEMQLARVGGYISYLKSYMVKASVEKADNLVIPKYDGVYTYDYIR